MTNILFFTLGLFLVILDSSLFAGPWLLLVYYASLLTGRDSEGSIGWLVIGILGDVISGRLVGISIVFLVMFFWIFRWVDEQFFGQKIPQWLVLMIFCGVWMWLFGGGIFKFGFVMAVSWLFGILLKKEKYVTLK